MLVVSRGWRGRGGGGGPGVGPLDLREFCYPGQIPASPAYMYAGGSAFRGASALTSRDFHRIPGGYGGFFAGQAGQAAAAAAPLGWDGGMASTPLPADAPGGCASERATATALLSSEAGTPTHHAAGGLLDDGCPLPRLEDAGGLAELGALEPLGSHPPEGKAVRRGSGGEEDPPQVGIARDEGPEPPEGLHVAGEAGGDSDRSDRSADGDSLLLPAVPGSAADLPSPLSDLVACGPLGKRSRDGGAPQTAKLPGAKRLAAGALNPLRTMPVADALEAVCDFLETDARVPPAEGHRDSLLVQARALLSRSRDAAA